MKHQSAMRSLLLYSLVAAAMPVCAQSSFLRRAGGKQERQTRVNIENVTLQNSAKTQTAPMRAAVVDEATDMQDDVRYRYVYAYNKDMERSSETIYMTTCEDGTWGSEVLLTVGTYSYEYDSQGRMKTKSVTYTDNDEFISYRIMADYGTSVTAYHKYEMDSEGSYCLVEEWEYHPNGVLASHTFYDGDWYTVRNDFNEVGMRVGWTYTDNYGDWQRSIYSTGSLNDSTCISYEDIYYNYRVDKYKYDPTSGNLLEYVYYNRYDAYKYEWEYDALGRMVSEKYYNESDYSDTRDLGTEPEWVLDEQTDYTYNSDEVYGVGNSWHDALNFDGPVKTYRFWERGDGDDYYCGPDSVTTTRTASDTYTDFEENIVFEYDSNGKLLSATHTQTGPTYDMSTIIMTIDVDDEGQITAVQREEFFYEEEDSISEYDHETTQYTYTWENGQLVKSITVEDDDYGPYTNTTTYSYGDGKVYKAETIDDNGYEYSYTSGALKEEDSYYEYVYYTSGSWTSLDELQVDVQQEDVIFTRPDIFKDVDGFTPDSTIVASIEGRVVACVRHQSIYDDVRYESFNCNYEYSDINGNSRYINTDDDTYFSISHDGDETICYNYIHLPVYVLQDGRLVREFIYHDEVYVVGNATEGDSESGETRAPQRRVTVKAGNEYTEIEYVYSSNGLLMGQNITEVASDGTRSEEVTIEYKYDEVTGIGEIEATSNAGLQLSGRMLGISEPSATFSVYTLGGMQIASGVSQYAFPKAGTYLVSVKGRTVKLIVK